MTPPSSCPPPSSRRINDHAAQDVAKACKLSLKNLQLDYLDLYLVTILTTVDYLLG